MRSHGASAGRGGGAGEGHHLLDGQPQFEAVQRVTDADLPLDLCVRQVGHDGAALHVGTTGCHVPGWHSHPQLEGGRQQVQLKVKIRHMDPDISHPLGFCDCTAPPAKIRRWVRPKMQREVLGDMLLPVAHAWKEEEELRKS